MMKYGTPAAVSAIALLLNLVMYTVSILLISAVCCAVHPDILLRMALVPKLFIAFGIVVQIAFIVLFVLCIFNERLILGFCRGDCGCCAECIYTKAMTSSMISCLRW